MAGHDLAELALSLSSVSHHDTHTIDLAVSTRSQAVYLLTLCAAEYLVYIGTASFPPDMSYNLLGMPSHVSGAYVHVSVFVVPSSMSLDPIPPWLFHQQGHMDVIIGIL